MGLTNFKESTRVQTKQSLKVDKRKRKISGNVTVLHFIDNESKQHIAYAPSLNVSGYGETEKKAKEMLKFSIDELFLFLISLDANKLTAEMRKLGWDNSEYFNKQYSTAFVDINGELKGLNAVDNNVELTTLEAA